MTEFPTSGNRRTALPFSMDLFRRRFEFDDDMRKSQVETINALREYYSRYMIDAMAQQHRSYTQRSSELGSLEVDIPVPINITQDRVSTVLNLVVSRFANFDIVTGTITGDELHVYHPVAKDYEQAPSTTPEALQESLEGGDIYLVKVVKHKHSVSAIMYHLSPSGVETQQIPFIKVADAREPMSYFYKDALIKFMVETKGRPIADGYEGKSAIIGEIIDGTQMSPLPQKIDYGGWDEVFAPLLEEKQQY